MDTEELGTRQGEQPEQMEDRSLRSREGRISPGGSTPNKLPGSHATIVYGHPLGLSSRRASWAWLGS